MASNKCDFIAKYGLGFPDLIDSILFHLLPTQLEQCRLVCTEWRDYIDNGNLKLKPQMKPDGRVWADKNREVSYRTVIYWYECKFIIIIINITKPLVGLFQVNYAIVLFYNLL